MHIDRAIEVLEGILSFVEPGDPADEHQAIGLGIEALKRVELHRTDRRYPFNTLLPGETQE